MAVPCVLLTRFAAAFVGGVHGFEPPFPQPTTANRGPCWSKELPSLPPPLPPLPPSLCAVCFYIVFYLYLCFVFCFSRYFLFLSSRTHRRRHTTTTTTTPPPLFICLVDRERMMKDAETLGIFACVFFGEKISAYCWEGKVSRDLPFSVT